MQQYSNYVLVTPARNEAQFIELTIKSVVAQTLRPIRWVVVSDGSTDGTDDIVNRYATQYSWIELLRMPERHERNFAGKVHAFSAGYARLKAIDYDAIGSLDADISFCEDYFSVLLGKLAGDPALGLVGTPFKDDRSKRSYDYRFVSIEHVSGACQLFRRTCFEDIGGYVPVKGGGVDHIAVLTARMKGWRTRTFTDRFSVHHREMGTAEHSALMAEFQQGSKDYTLGGHPLWELFRTVHHMTRRPFFIGGLMMAVGYVWASARRLDRPVSHELIAFHRHEQIDRLKRYFLSNRSTDSQSSQYPSHYA
jgi:hypothetical protein